MTKAILVTMVATFAASMIISSGAEARGRTGSHRSGGYNSHGKGSHYYGGH